MYTNYRWLMNVRGISAREFRILAYLSERANGAGRIDAALCRTMSEYCEVSPRNVWATLHELQYHKRLIQARTINTGNRGQRASGFQLNFERMYPDDTLRGRCKNGRNGEPCRIPFPAHANLGRQFWLTLLKKLPRLEMPAADDKNPAWWNEETRVLTVWFDSKREMLYYENLAPQFARVFTAIESVKIRRLDFLRSS